MESIRKNLIWRLSSLRPNVIYPSSSILRCLPSHARDPFGRPIVIMKVSALTKGLGAFRNRIMPTMERLRAHLKDINDRRIDEADSEETQPTLQYVLLLDLADLSMQSVVS